MITVTPRGSHCLDHDFGLMVVALGFLSPDFGLILVALNGLVLSLSQKSGASSKSHSSTDHLTRLWAAIDHSINTLPPQRKRQNTSENWGEWEGEK